VVVIVDDSSAVWPHDRRNLFVVERYIYFPSSRKRFGMQGKSLLEIDRCDWQ
jgi:RNA polymerase II C-terminal domain phosphatase-like 3/4